MAKRRRTLPRMGQVRRLRRHVAGVFTAASPNCYASTFATPYSTYCGLVSRRVACRRGDACRAGAPLAPIPEVGAAAALRASIEHLCYVELGGLPQQSFLVEVDRPQHVPCLTMLP